MTEVKTTIEQLNSLHGDIPNSVLGLDHWGAKDTVAGTWLQPDAKRCITEKLVEKKPTVRTLNRKLTESIIEMLIDFGFFKKKRSEKDVMLAVQIIMQFVDVPKIREIIGNRKKENPT